MPSLWSRIGANRRKYQTEETSAKPVKTAGKDKGRQSRMKRLFSFGSKDKKVPQNVQRQTSLNANPVFPHMAPKSKGIERGIEDEKEADRQLLDNIVNSSQASNRRRLAYEIFQDSNKPTTPKARKNETAHFVSEPCLVQDHKPAQNSTPQWQKFGRDKEFQSVETRPKKPGLFSGFPAREQRHSVVGDFPFQQRPQMRAMQARRSDSMYGYVPRAVSLHDATSLLLGKDKEETSKHTNSMLDRFAPCPGWGAGLGIPEDIAGENDNISFSSHDFQTNRQHSKNIHPVNGLEAVTGPQDFDNHSQHSANRVIPGKLQNGEGNFYFSQPSLNAKSENFTRQDYEFWTGGTSKPRDSSTSGALENPFSGNGNSENDVKKSKNNNNSNYYVVTGDNVNLSSDREKEVKSPSRLTNVDKRNGNETSGTTDEDQLEGLFSTVGEVLY